MALTSAPAALRGAFGFLTRLPVGHDEAGWAAFRRQPATFPVVGSVVGCLAALPLLAPGVPAPTAAVGYLATVYLLTGITHLDGVADCGDAAVVHGDRDDRRAVLKDTTTGVGAVAAVAFVLVVLALGALAAGRLGSTLGVVAVVVGAEVGAKTAMAALVCLGDAAHDGLGASLLGESTARDLAPVLLIAASVVGLLGLAGGGRAASAAGVALAAALAVGLLVAWWARTRLGGVTGDVLGAANELGRLAALHLGVVAWLA